MLRTVGSKLFSGVRLARGFHTRAALLADDATGAVGLKLRFATPYKIIVGGEHVHMVSIPGEDGEFGVLANHVPTISPLKPGVVSIHHGNAMDLDVKHYFVSGGFALITPEETSITAVEASPLNELDPAAVSKGLEEAKGQMAAAQTDEEKALAQIGLDVHEAMTFALSKM